MAVIDYNKIQSLDSVENTLGWSAPRQAGVFRWRVLESPGHDVDALAAALDVDASAQTQPTVVIAHTTKGKGVFHGGFSPLALPNPTRRRVRGGDG